MAALNKKWEYITLLISLNRYESTPEELNRLGNEGWELMGVVTVGNAFQCVLKRVVRKKDGN